MWRDFYFQNFHFAVNTFAAFVFFAVFWLHLDAWTQRKTTREFLRAAGFLLVSLSLLHHAMVTKLFENTETIAKTAGYGLILWSLIIDPIMPLPVYDDEPQKKKKHSFLPFSVMNSFLTVLLSGGIAGLYWRKATKGLERHLKPLAIGFTIITVYELLGLRILAEHSNNITYVTLFKDYQAVWILEHIVLLGGVLIIGRWGLNYLLKQIHTQVFITFALSVVLIFVVTTLAFTTLLIRRVENESITQLQIDTKLMQFSLDTQKEYTLANADVIAQNAQVAQDIQKLNVQDLGGVIEQFLVSQNTDSIIITNNEGKVLARGNDKGKVNDSLSDDFFVKKGLSGERVSSFIAREGTLAQEVHIAAVSPIKTDKVIGAVIVEKVVDNAFIDGLKKKTDLDISVYTDNKLSATSLRNTNGDVLLAIKELNKKVTAKVLDKGEQYLGSVQLQGTIYLGIYSPLKNSNDTTIGMIFIGQVQDRTIETLQQSTRYTFLIAILLLFFSMFPLYIISKKISNQSQ